MPQAAMSRASSIAARPACWAESRQPTRSSYIPTLDGWRAIAISGVLLHHAFNPLSYGGVFDLGELGVMLFFAISGFLITNRLLEESDCTGTLSLKNFYVRRAFRILPPAFFYLAIICFLGLFNIVNCSEKEVLACIIFLRNYVTANVGWYTSHFWSLAVEEHFYLFWPLAFVIAGRKRLLWIAPCLAVTVILWRVVDGHFDFLARTVHNPALFGSPFRTDRCADGLFWGCTLALWLSTKPAVPRWIGTSFSLLVIAVVLGARYFAIPHNYAIAGVGMAALVGSTALKPESLIGRFLEQAPLRFVGRISYSLYLWQMLFFIWQQNHAWQRLPFNVVFAFLCAIFSYYVIEKPFIRLGHRATQTAPRVAIVKA